MQQNKSFLTPTKILSEFSLAECTLAQAYSPLASISSWSILSFFWISSYLICFFLYSALRNLRFFFFSSRVSNALLYSTLERRQFLLFNM